MPSDDPEGQAVDAIDLRQVSAIRDPGTRGHPFAQGAVGCVSDCAGSAARTSIGESIREYITKFPHQVSALQN